MRLFNWAKDGGEESHVHGLYIIEIKPLFSVVLLRFTQGSREAYHNHAFNAITWVLSGEFEEHKLNKQVKAYKPSLKPKITPRTCFHKVVSKGTTWAISFRGPWTKTWKEYHPKEDKLYTLTSGRKIVGVD